MPKADECEQRWPKRLVFNYKQTRAEVINLKHRHLWGWLTHTDSPPSLPTTSPPTHTHLASFLRHTYSPAQPWKVLITEEPEVLCTYCAVFRDTHTHWRWKTQQRLLSHLPEKLSPHPDLPRRGPAGPDVFSPRTPWLLQLLQHTHTHTDTSALSHKHMHTHKSTNVCSRTVNSFFSHFLNINVDNYWPLTFDCFCYPQRQTRISLWSFHWHWCGWQELLMEVI